MKDTLTNIAAGSFYAILVAGLALLMASCATTSPPSGVSHEVVSTQKSDGVVKERTIVRTNELYEIPEQPTTGEHDGASPEEVARHAEMAMAFSIGPGDALDFKFYDDPALSREVVVRYDGCVSLPLINDIKLSGLTREEAVEAVRDAYSTVFRNPRLSLTVNEVMSKSYFVMGDVERPDEYPYERPISLLQAINLAGGLRVDTREGESYIGAQGQLTKAFLIRHVSGHREVFEHDLRGLRHPGEHPSDTPVFPGDVVYLPEGLNLVYVLGEVQNPNVYPLLDGTTVLQLLVRAGGPLERTARMRGAVLLRQVDGQHTEAMLIDVRKALQTGASPEVHAGDILYVPRGALVSLHDNLMRFTQLTETVSPILDLYMKAYDAYYTRDRYDQLLDDDSRYGTTPLSVLETVANLGLLRR